MYLNTGNGKYLRKKRILGIFDMDSATVCVATRRTLSKMEKEGRVLDADGEIPKSFLLLDKEDQKESKKDKRKDKIKDKKQEILLCKFSSGVLFGRLKGVTFEEEDESVQKDKSSERD